VVHALADYGIQVSIFDPWAKPSEVQHEYKLTTTTQLPADSFDAIVLGVAHKEFTTIDLSKLKKPNGVLFDVKGVLTEKADGRL
jgi:UDP-N-acetyl-D-galactosamine dehydrogenase